MIWYAYFYSLMFEYLFINVSLEPLVGTCRENSAIEVCTVLARLLLWLMDLPLNIVIFGTFAFLLVVGEEYIANLQISYIGIAFGVVVGYGIAIFGWYEVSLISYYLVSLLTYLVLLLGAIWSFRHLTSKGTGRDKAAPVL